MAEGGRALRDSDVVLQVQAGGPAAAGAERELCLRFLPRIRFFLARELSGVFEIDDIAHDVVIELLRAVREDRVREPERVGAFALGISRNKVREVVRQRHRRELAHRRIEPVTDDNVPAPRVALGRLEECLHGLSERERTILRMTLVEGSPAAAAADELELSAANVRVIRHRAIDSLRRCLRVGRYEVQRR